MKRAGLANLPRGGGRKFFNSKPIPDNAWLFPRFNTGKVMRALYVGDRSKYKPHQGHQECERRRRQADAKSR